MSVNKHKMLSVCIKYAMRDLIPDVIKYCASSFADGSVYDQIVLKKTKKEKIWTSKKFLHEFPSKR